MASMSVGQAAVRDRVLALLGHYPGGVTDGQLTAEFGQLEVVLPVLNSMMQANRLNSMQLATGGILFRLVEEQVNSRTRATPCATSSSPAMSRCGRFF